ncbi:golgin candidate 5 [Quillaja saponaria]|uniref:Golgin candidate 5 n=1 Tax=Quillaja saponaria TaxID=32244 RepID=A0AAD7L551_QUISA|nr:golgin candidate 5 [Quillaja saponaria]
MAWFSGKVSLGNFPDLAGAVNKLQESVKNIEKNFDTALGYEEKSESSNEASGLWPTATDRKALFDPVMAFMGQKSEETTAETSGKLESSQKQPEAEKTSEKPESPDKSAAEGKEGVETDKSVHTATEESRTSETTSEEENKAIIGEKDDKDPESTVGTMTMISDHGKAESESQLVPVEPPESSIQNVDTAVSTENVKELEISEVRSTNSPESAQPNLVTVGEEQLEGSIIEPDETHTVVNLHENNSSSEHKTQEESKDEEKTQAEESVETASLVRSEASSDSKNADGIEPSSLLLVDNEEAASPVLSYNENVSNSIPSTKASEVVSKLVSLENDLFTKANERNQVAGDVDTDNREQRLSSGTNMSDASSDSVLELEKVKMEMKMMETALQGAARQAQAKADEIAKLMNENEHMKAVIEDLKGKSNEAEIEYLREEYHQRVATLERKVYALTRERDTLRREQNKKSDAAALLKEKDEIITQVMAEGEELSKKQAAQESTIRKLRAQTRELEEEKKGLMTKLQVEENKVESIKKDKMATEKLLQETIEKHQTELAAQKEYYTNALAAAKEAEALAEARVNNEARSELESHLREAEEREYMLVQALEELRQTLSRKEQQAVFKEDMFQRDIEDLQKRYQASERRCEELITQVPESTRPLLRQIEAMQETTARRAEAWAAVERTLNSRLQEAEGKAAAAEERERSMNERLSQTLSRINVLEAQISMLRAEQTQLSKSLEKERQRAAENRQEYLAAKEEADTLEGRANQLVEEIRGLRQKHKQELQEALMHRELLQQEIEKEKAARLDLERTSRARSDLPSITKQNSAFENGNLTRKISSASSLGSIEESYFLQASLDSSDSFYERRNPGEPSMSPYYMKSMTPSSFEAALRQKEGELASYMSRLASLESIRDSLAEELVKMTAQCEKLQAEAATLPGLRAELEALRRRHSSALELMGERDEELEELRADIVDLKEMYREQVNLLVNKIQIMSSSIG